MKTKQILAVMALVLGLSMSSCIEHKGSDDFQKITQTYPGYINEIIDEESGEIYLYPGVNYTVEFNMSNLKCNLKLEGLKLPNGQNFPTLAFNEVNWANNERGWAEIGLIDYKPEGVGGFVQAPVFSRFLFQTVNRYINGNFLPLVNASYRIDNYQIFSLPSEILETGTTKVVNKDDNSVYEPNDETNPTLYYIQLDATTRKAKITVVGAKFHKDMPAMNIRFSGISFDTTTAGDVILACDKLIPSLLKGDTAATATEVPMENFPITNLKVTYDSDRGIWVSYTCTISTPNMKGEYDVTMIDQFPDKVTDFSNY